LKKLHVQRYFWKGHNKNSLCWAFQCVNNGKEVEVGSHQVMRCILRYDNVVNILNPRTEKKKGFITYYKIYGIITLKKHVDVDHSIITKRFEETINNEIIENVEKQHIKKRPNVLKESFKKDDVQQKDFLQDLGLFISRKWSFCNWSLRLIFSCK
jgi:hemerythrin-like domain-containing protein